MRFSELDGKKVVTESGLELGRVHDVRGELQADRLRITGFCCGRHGVLERYGIGTRGSGGAGQVKVHGHPLIKWSRVIRVGAEIVVRD